MEEYTELCNKHNKEYTKIFNDKMYCDKCDFTLGVKHINIDDWKKQTLIEMEKFKSRLNTKIKGLTCIADIINKYDESIIKQIENIIDTIFVDFSHIDNFTKMINDNNIPISHMIKRKNQILNNELVISINKTDKIDKYLIEFIDIIITKNNGDIHANKDEVLRWASYHGYLDIVECLISHGIDIHARKDGAFRSASRNGNLAVVECLIKNGADIHAEKDNALMSASRNGHLAIVECLIKNGADRATPNLGVAADIHACNDDALQCASCDGHLAVVECLISNGADIHIHNDSALRWASYGGHLAIVEYLISHGADRATPNLGVAADIHAGLASPRPDKVGNDDGSLRYASQNGHLVVVEYLIKHGADIHAKNNEALRWASMYGRLAVVEYLKQIMNN
jgi:ankyrin repeat protein